MLLRSHWRAGLWPALAMSLLFLAGCGPMTLTLGVPPDHNRLELNVVEPGHGLWPPRVAIIDISGMIHDSTKPALLTVGENPVALFQERLQAAACDPKVKAVILRLNTPGGTVTASDEMYRLIMRFKNQTHKPVIAMMMEVTASGGYYVACSADRIVAYPTTITGSIGVIAELFSVQDGLSRIGIHTYDITSGPNKDAGSPFSTLTPAQRTIFQGLINDFYHRFLTIVRTNRPNIPADRFAELTDGRVVSGQMAATVGLVDRVGDLHDAFVLAQHMAGIHGAQLVLYERPFNYVNSPYAQAPDTHVNATTQINLAQFNIQGLAADAPMGFYYLWQP